jgi:hypothetical protein
MTPPFLLNDQYIVYPRSSLKMLIAAIGNESAHSKLQIPLTYLQNIRQ